MTSPLPTSFEPRNQPRVTRDEFTRLRAGEQLHDLTDGKTYVVRASSATTCEATDERFEVFDLTYRTTFVKLPPSVAAEATPTVGIFGAAA